MDNKRKTLKLKRIINSCIFFLLTFSALGAESNNLLETGIKYFKSNQFDAAISVLSQTLETETNNAKAFYYRGAAYYEKSQFNLSISDLNRSIDLSRLSPALSNNYILAFSYYTRGNAFGCINLYSNAIADYSESIKIYPNHYLTYLRRANAYYILGEISHSISDCNAALSINTNLSDAYWQRAADYKAIGLYSDALNDSNYSIMLGNRDSHVFILRAEIYGVQKNYACAINDCSQVIVSSPKNAFAYSVRGILYSKTGDYDNGIADCKKALDLNTNTATVYNNLAWVLATSPNKYQRDGLLALGYAKKACDLNGWSQYEFLGTYAAALAENNDFTNAVIWQQKAIDLGVGGEELSDAQERLNLYKQGKPYHFPKK